MKQKYQKPTDTFLLSLAMLRSVRKKLHLTHIIFKLLPNLKLLKDFQIVLLNNNFLEQVHLLLPLTLARSAASHALLLSMSSLVHIRIKRLRSVQGGPLVNEKSSHGYTIKKDKMIFLVRNSDKNRLFNVFTQETLKAVSDPKFDQNCQSTLLIT